MTATTRDRPQNCRLQLLLSVEACRLDWRLVVRESIKGGVDLLQIREKHRSTPGLIEFAHEVLEIVGGRIPVLINDDVEAAAVVPVQGVHLGQEDVSPAFARDRLPRDRWIGVSTHSLSEIQAATEAGATHLGFGCCFATPTKEVPKLQDPAAIAAACQSATLPLFAIGGIQTENVAELRTLGIQRIAVSSAILGSSKPGRRAAQLRSPLTES